ncbi:secreted beta amyloid precursor protein-like protein [Sarcoptes scabiei]|uniref:Secreted beta amyloid protein-like protein n=1 Tax=Sarcoptes scabiei TaxID=52283 RepID=A0A132ACW4_SARSC|nr:secreted beta amyloid precursor protein-like protein [Sarcoptes scabiei]
MKRKKLKFFVALAANLDSSSLGHFQPMVAILCGHGKYHNQYLSEENKWISDFDSRAVCTKNTLEILEYCRKVCCSFFSVYSTITLLKYFKLIYFFFLNDNLYFCLNLHFTKCKSKHYVKPYRCLEGSFQSDALLVPELCVFDHIHNKSLCQNSQYWNHTAIISCSIRNMKLQSYAMLLPCGVGIFSGVEFVCCPHSDSGSNNHIGAGAAAAASAAAFKDAQKALDEGHKSKVTKVMKEWSELEEHYQEMRIKDFKKADEFKKRMTNRFQKTVEALEEESSAEKRQIISMHQQRVMSIINMRKKSAMDCYTQSLDEVQPKSKKIEKCLKKLLRALEKDRVHTLHHYKHLLNLFTKQALNDKKAILDHLTDLIKMANQSIQMLDRIPNVADRIKFRMIAYWHNLRGIPIEQSISHETELAIMNRYEEEVAQRQIERERQKNFDDVNRERDFKESSNDNSRPKITNKMRQELDQESMEEETKAQQSEDIDMGGSRESSSSSINANRKISSTTPTIMLTSTVATSSAGLKNKDSWSQEETEFNEINHQHNKPLYLQSQSFHHNEPSFTIKREHHSKIKWNGSVYLTLAFAGIALLTATIVGVVLLRKHTQTSPHNQGFIEVNQAASPEEKHMIQMQINGYENPTFRYFETQED